MKSAVGISFAIVFSLAIFAAIVPIGDIYASACCGGDGPGPDGSHGRDPIVTTPFTPAVKKPVCTLVVTPGEIEKGESIKLTWTTTNAYSVKINQGIGAVAVNGSKNVTNVTSSRTYTLTATGAGGSVTCLDSVEVKTPPPPPEKPVCTFDVSPSTIDAGDSITLSWTTTNATNVSINQGVGTVALDGSKAVNNVTASKTYMLTATGSGGTVTCSDSVTVEEEPEEPVCTIWADDTTLISGESTTLRWDSTNATSATLTQFGSVSVDGTRNTGALFSTNTYVLTATGEGGSVQCSVSIGVLPHEPEEPSCDISADDSSIQYGEGTTLRWNSDNATSASLTQFGSVAVDGSRYTGALFASKTYILTVYGEGGSDQCSVTIQVEEEDEEQPSCDIYADDTFLDNGQGTTLRWNSDNATSASLTQFGSVSVDGSRFTGALYASKTFTLTVYGEAGSDQCTVTIEVDDEYQDEEPSCDIWADESDLEDGQSTVLRWNSENATSASLSSFGTVSLDGSRSTGALYSTRTYTLNVWGAGGGEQCSVTIYVDDEYSPPDYHDEPSCWIHVTTTYQSGYDYYNHEQRTLSWGSENATWASISSVGQVALDGSRTVYGGTGGYTMTVWGPGGSAVCETDADFIPPPPYVPPPVYQIPPYVTLSQIPYTGFDLGLLGNAVLWLSITLVAVFGAVALAYYRSDVLSLPFALARGRVAPRSRLSEFLPDEAVSFTPVRFLA